MSDLEIIALSCVTEALGIDSENLLWENCRTITRTCSPSFSAVPALIAAGEGCCPYQALQGLVVAKLQGQSNTTVVDQ